MENTYFEHFCLQKFSVRAGPLANGLHFDKKRFSHFSSLECISWQRPTYPLIIDSLKGEKGQEPLLPKRTYSVLVCLGQSAFEWVCLDQQTKRESWGLWLFSLRPYLFHFWRADIRSVLPQGEIMLLTEFYLNGIRIKKKPTILTEEQKAEERYRQALAAGTRLSFDEYKEKVLNRD